jgi:hypothetical protein
MWPVGVLTLALLLHGLWRRPRLSVSDHMRRSNGYRAALCALMLVQFWAWLGACKTEAGQLLVGAAAGGWLGLTLQLRGRTHYLWTSLFGVSFSLMAFSLYPSLEGPLKMIWWTGFAGLFVTISWCLVRLATNWRWIAVPEHAAFAVYSATYAAFFWVIQ